MASGDDHDQNFKNLILDYPLQALALFAGKEAPAPGDEVTVVPLRQEQLKARLGDRFRELDVPLMIEWPDGRREALLFVLEEETDPRRFSIHRLAHYCLDLAELFETDRVVPVVIFLRTRNRTPTQLSLGTERHAYLIFDYLSCTLSAMPFEEWADSDNLVARLNLPNMYWRADQKIDVYAQAIRGLFALEPDGDKRVKYMDFIDIYTGLTDNERARYAREYPEENAAMAGFAERFRAEGMEQGLEQGLEQGREQGLEQGRRLEARTVLERLLQRRFGPIPPDATARLENGSLDDLEQWTDRVLDARTLDEVFE